MNWTKHPIIPLPTKEKLKTLLDTKGAQAVFDLWKSREEAIKLSKEDPYHYGVTLESWKNAIDSLDSVDSLIISGGNRCLDGKQKIWDPVAQKSRRVDEIDDDFHVFAYDESTGQQVPAKALAPFRKPAQDLFRVGLSNGELFHCSNTHLVRTFGSYRPIADVTFLDAPTVKDAWSADLPLFDGFHLVSTVDIGLLRSQTNAFRLWKTVQDSQYDCRLLLHSDDGQLLASSGVDLSDSPSLADALTRMGYASDGSDALVNIPRCSRLCLQFDLLSNRDDHHQSVGQCVDSECHVSCTPCKSASLSHEDQEWLQAHQQSIVEFSRRLRSSVLSGSQGILLHYVYSLGGNRSYFNQVVKFDFLRNDTVWDFTVPKYHNYFIGDTLHHNSGKTEFCAKMVVQAAIQNDGSEIVCFAQDDSASKRIQQKAIYRYLPPEFKNKRKEKTAYLNYSEQNGFTGYQFILPNGSRIYFHTYSQFQLNRGKFEGLELGSELPTSPNIGMWCDEYLEDGDLIQTMVFRLATRNAKMIISATPVKGYTPFIGSYLKDAETIKTRPAKLLGGEQVPCVQRNHAQNLDIVYFHSDQNPFGGYERIAKELSGKPKDTILTRAYGIPVKSQTTLFPLFNTAVHVIDKSPAYNSKQWTAYQVVDPAGARNYTCLWAMVNKDGDVHVLREWPDKDTYGPWAEFGDPKWKHGPASDKLGYNIDRYIELFEDIESDLGVEVYERFIDSRFASREGNNNSTLFDDFSDSGMDFLPTDGKEIDRGISGLDQWFWYNANEDVDSANKPQLTIHKSCGNLVHSLINWGNNGKKDEALKDFVDCLRYLRMCNDGDGPDHVTFRSLETTRVGNGGY